MSMFTSYGHINRPKLNQRFFDDFAWVSPFNKEVGYTLP